MPPAPANALPPAPPPPKVALPPVPPLTVEPPTPTPALPAAEAPPGEVPGVLVAEEQPTAADRQSVCVEITKRTEERSDMFAFTQSKGSASGTRLPFAPNHRLVSP
jgi:hypothetical protein